MSLLTYKESRPWARSIANAVKTGVMPPWHADPAVGHFRNERRLTDAQKATIVRWVDAGAPEGDPKDLPPAPQYVSGWRIGQPDVVLEMQEDYPIPATGEVPYLYFEVPANFAEDRWIQQWEMRPGNPAVVHHVIVYVRPPQQAGPGAAALVQALGGAAAVQRPVYVRRWHGDSRRADGRTPAARRSAQAAARQLPAAAARHGRLDWRLRSGQLDARVP